VLAAFDGLRFGRPAPAMDPPRLCGLYLLGGFGARGLTFAPLLGEAAAAAVLGEPAPFDDAVAPILDPARFLLRSLKRR
jgi:tRNA 5-methylaminomethyl-2-thiouridine biosynthesis bifunctional protein